MGAVSGGELCRSRTTLLLRCAGASAAPGACRALAPRARSAPLRTCGPGARTAARRPAQPPRAARPQGGAPAGATRVDRQPAAGGPTDAAGAGVRPPPQPPPQPAEQPEQPPAAASQQQQDSPGPQAVLQGEYDRLFVARTLEASVDDLDEPASGSAGSSNPSSADSMTSAYDTADGGAAAAAAALAAAAARQPPPNASALPLPLPLLPPPPPPAAASPRAASPAASVEGQIAGGQITDDAQIASLAMVMEEAQQLEADLSAAITTAAQELGLGQEATQQLTSVLRKLERLEEDLTAAITVAAPEAAEAAAGAAGDAPPPGALAAAAAAALEAAALEARATPTPEPAAEPAAAAATAAAGPSSSAFADSAKLWALFVLGLSYVHQSTTGFALPAMLPMIAPDLRLSDFQGALLTSGYSYLYALALVPVGLLADRVPRPKLLAVGIVLWSALSVAASRAGSFGELMLTRVGFAAAQAVQNPVSFSLIPDLFPDNKSTALAAYNCAIYLGRALSFAAVLAAHRLGERGPGGGALDSADSAAGAAAGAAEPGLALSMVPLDKLDLQRMSIIYTTGDMAAVTPVYNYNFHVIAYEAAAGGASFDGAWRPLLFWLGVPGVAVATMMALSVAEPRADAEKARQAAEAAAAAAAPAEQQQKQEAPGGGSAAEGDGGGGGGRGGVVGLQQALHGIGEGIGGGVDALMHRLGQQQGEEKQQQQLQQHQQQEGEQAGPLPLQAQQHEAEQPQGDPAAALATAAAAPAGADGFGGAALAPVRQLLANRAFRTTTLAAALNDLGSYALIAWHSTFYERVFGLDSSVYAPMLAVILPVGGIVGGVGGGLIADVLSAVGGRYWLTSGASILAAPFIAKSLLADSTTDSFLALLVGFAMSEAWRAPSAIMIRTIAPQELGSTASALYLCIRNLVGGAGPVAVATLSPVIGLQRAMLLAPACYVVSGLLFLLAERAIEEQERAAKLAAAAAAPAGAAARA